MVVVGDSIIKFMNIPLIGKCEAKTIPSSGCKTDRCLQEINKLAEEYTVENLVIHIGTNDLKDDPHDVTLKIIKLLERTKLIFPTTSIYFSSILPKYNTKLFSRINYINGNVYSFCERVQIKYISHHTFATKDHEINTDLFREDMLHPSRKGTKQLARNFISVYRGKSYY